MGRELNFSAEDILDFSEDKFERKVRKFREKPRYITWEITNNCNLHCKHCVLPSVGKPLEDELTQTEACQIIDNIVESGAKALLFSGGEPLMRGDILEIARYASRFLRISIQTNGYLLEDYAPELKNAGFEHVQVSLDGAEAPTHDYLRGEGSFERALKGIKKCSELGFSMLSICAVIHRSNLEELPRMIDLALDLEANYFEARCFVAVGAGQEISELALSLDQRREFYKYLAAKEQEIRIVGTEDPYIFIENKAMRDACLDPYSQMACIGCGAGIVGCAIAANGKVLPCSGLRFEVGDLRTEKLIDIWTNSYVLQLLRDRKNLKGKCGACEYKYACGGCRGMATLNSGNVMSEDPLCWYTPELPVQP